MESRRSSSRHTPAGRVERPREKAAAPAPSRLRISAETGRWEEPKPATPVPSFADHRGMERMGVLADQYALGQNPPRSYTTKHKLSSFHPGRATPTQVATPTAVTEDEGVAPSSQAAREASSVDVPTSSESPSPVTERLTMSTPTEIAKLAAVSEAIALNNLTTWQPDAPVRDVLDQVIITPNSASHLNEVPTHPLFPVSNHTPVQSPPKVVNGTFHPHTLSRHVEAALRQVDEKHPDLAVGLRTLREDCGRDPALWAVLDGILSHNQSMDQQKTFRHYIKRGKKSYHLTMSSNSTPTGKSSLSNGRLTRQIAKPASDSGHLLPSPSPLNPSYPLNNNKFPSTSTSKSNQPQFLPSTITMELPDVNGDSDMMDPPSPPPPALTAGDGSRQSSVSSTLSSLLSHQDLEAMALEIEQTQTNGAKTRSRKSLPAQRQAPTKPKTASKKTKGPKKGFIFRGGADAKANNSELAEAQREADEWREKFRQDQPFHEDYSGTYYDNSSVKDRSRPLSTPKPTTDEPVRRASIHQRSVLTRSERQANASRSESLLSASLPDRPFLKRARYDSETTEEDESPPSSPGGLLVPPPPGAARSTRSSSPRGTRKPPAKRVKSARVMISPNKPKDGTSTAAARSALQYSQEDAENSDGEDNNDFCGACGENGRLLCCDSCPNSFHFKCLDPPMKTAPEGAWYCSKCKARQSSRSSEEQHHGLFSKAITAFQNTNPRVYSLSDESKNYYEGVKSKESGSYQEFSMPRTQVNDKALYKYGKEVTPKQPIPLEPYKVFTDRHGKTIICDQCQRAADGKRVLIPCDYCPKYFHLDCLDPPLADVPRRGPDGSEGGSWMCPGHVHYNVPNPTSLLKRRQPKKAVTLDAPTTRGFKNDGRIEVNLEPEEPVEFAEHEIRGRKWRVSEKGIILDFVDKVRRDNDRAAHNRRLLDLEAIGGVDYIRGQVRDEIRAELRTEMEDARKLSTKTFREQQAVLNLQSLSQQQPSEYSQSIADLTAQLITSAPIDVVHIQEQHEQDERGQLQYLNSLLQRRLTALGPAPSSTQNNTSQNAPVTASPSQPRTTSQPAPAPAPAPATAPDPAVQITSAADSDTTSDRGIDTDVGVGVSTSLRPSSSPPIVRKSGRERRSTSRNLGSLLVNGTNNSRDSGPGANRRSGRSVSRGRLEKNADTTANTTAALLKVNRRQRSRGVSLGRK